MEQTMHTCTAPWIRLSPGKGGDDHSMATCNSRRTESRAREDRGTTRRRLTMKLGREPPPVSVISITRTRGAWARAQRPQAACDRNARRSGPSVGQHMPHAADVRLEVRLNEFAETARGEPRSRGGACVSSVDRETMHYHWPGSCVKRAQSPRSPAQAPSTEAYERSRDRSRSAADREGTPSGASGGCHQRARLRTHIPLRVRGRMRKSEFRVQSSALGVGMRPSRVRARRNARLGM
ncbi:hypothetical protein GY45DRAFT_1004407 [Cubamyces sp. BRFM 1775]|nr:hypothetical protein GY45DRAFT_1004407 [Cubamyces sp. BRFM 1775]